MAERADPIPPSNGALAQGLITQHLQRVISCHQRVLDRHDPEPLHQMRVAMRRLRTTLQQFAPLLVLPAEVTDRRLGRVVRRLGMARDLDVLQGRLVDTFMPQLPKAEEAALQPVLKALRRERHQARDHLRDVLHSSGHLSLVAALQQWLKQPRTTPLAAQPAQEWLLEWQLPGLQTLMLHPAWLVSEAGAEVDSLHALRKQIKTARYQLENLAGLMGPQVQPWIGHLRQGQDLLGELNDLEVLRQAIEDQLPSGLRQSLPQLHWLLQQHGLRCWSLWREQVDLLWTPRQRRRLPLVLIHAAGHAAGERGVKAAFMRMLVRLG